MPNKKRLVIGLAVLGSAMLLMAGYNRPYRWWPINDLTEQTYIKSFTEGSGRAPVAGTVSTEQWDDVPDKMAVLMSAGDHPDIEAAVPTSVESIARGKKHYDIYCFPCHGEELSPDPARYSPVRAGKRPGSDSTWVMPAADINLIKMYTDEHIYSVISNGSAIMKRMSYHLSPDERWDVVNYVRSLADRAK